MKALKWAGASLLGLLGGLLGLVGVLLCVTLVLAPVGIPVLFLARRLFKTAGQLVVPRGVRHPVDELDKAGSNTVDALKRRSRKRAGKAAGRVGEKGAQAGKTARKSGRRTSKAMRKKSGRAGKRLKDAVPGS